MEIDNVLLIYHPVDIDNLYRELEIRLQNYLNFYKSNINYRNMRNYKIIMDLFDVCAYYRNVLLDYLKSTNSPYYAQYAFNKLSQEKHAFTKTQNSVNPSIYGTKFI